MLTGCFHHWCIQSFPQKRILPPFNFFPENPVKDPQCCWLTESMARETQILEDTNWCQQRSILFPCGFFCLKRVSIFSTGRRVFIARASQVRRHARYVVQIMGEPAWWSAIHRRAPGNFSLMTFAVASLLHSIIVIHVPNSWAWHM